MSEIVTDGEGQEFVLSIRRGGGTTLSPFGGWSLRSALNRVASIRGIVDDPGNRNALTRALVELGMASLGQSLSQWEVRGLSEEAFTSGAFSLTPYTRELRPICDVTSAAPAEDLTADLMEEAEELRVTHTLEIELVDEDDQPVPHVAYRVELPDGEIVQGSLNKQGRAMLTGIRDAGNCKVTFPRLDQSAWAPA